MVAGAEACESSEASGQGVFLSANAAGSNSNHNARKFIALIRCCRPPKIAFW